MKTAEVPLTQGKVAIIDAGDAEAVAQYRWYAARHETQWYAEARVGGRTIYLHRFVMDAEPEIQIDHKNLNGLDCRRSSLRRATNAQNNQNKEKHPLNTSGYKGVYWQKARGRWMAYINVDGKRISLGYYDDLEYAARIYDQAARKHHGAFARLNFPNENVPVEMSTGKLRRDNIHGYRGITPYRLDPSRWVMQLTVNKKLVAHGIYPSAEDAARAYDEAAERHLGGEGKTKLRLSE